MSVRLAVSVQPADDLRRALLPLFSRGEVDAIEWSWEAGTPSWLETLVAFYGSERALYTHLVGFPLTGDGSTIPRRLAEVARQSRLVQPNHLTAHFGLVQATGFSDMAPLPPVPCVELVSTGRERLARLSDAAGCPVGVENLALAFSTDDVARQADLIDTMLPRDGFVLLDLHNLHCQAVNFDIDPSRLLDRYPLERVREIHVSGGSVSYPKSDSRPFRRDTHDGTVPEGVLTLLDLARARCPRLEVVCLERLGGTLPKPEDELDVARDFERTRTRLGAAPILRAVDRPLPNGAADDIALSSIDPSTLRAFESRLVDVLMMGFSVKETREAMVRFATLPALVAYVERMEPRALEVAIELEKRWAKRATDGHER